MAARLIPKNQESELILLCTTGDYCDTTVKSKRKNGNDVTSNSKRLPLYGVDSKEGQKYKIA